MLIANPIYDVVFKFLMEDMDSAKELLSTMIGEPIQDLDFSSPERILPVEATNTLTVCRFDFTAKIKTDTGYKTVSIELQKAKLITDLMRFRRYLGLQYESPNNSEPGDKTKARQLYCIYFLDYDIVEKEIPEKGEQPKTHPVIQVNYLAKDAATGEVLPKQGEFIEGLHHKSWIVQIRQLEGKRRTDLEKLLSVFDQTLSASVDNHTLEINEDSLPEAYRNLLRRLRKANETPKIREGMTLEDDLLTDLQHRERREAAMRQKIEEQTQALTAKDAELALEKQKAHESKLASARTLKALGKLSAEEIAKATGLGVGEVEGA
jgi:hypothetical protein